jgi:hypothetical protein
MDLNTVTVVKPSTADFSHLLENPGNKQDSQITNDKQRSNQQPAEYVLSAAL